MIIAGIVDDINPDNRILIDINKDVLRIDIGSYTDPQEGGSIIVSREEFITTMQYLLQRLDNA